MESKTYNIVLPTDEDTVKKLKVGDIVYLSGTIATGRDLVHKRVIDFNNNEKEIPPLFLKLKNSAIYHCGPIVKAEDGKYKIISAGPTTSARMNPFQHEFDKILGIKFVIGKGGMIPKSWDNPPSVYLQYPGGAGAIIVKFIEEVESVEWTELGPEAAWFLKVKDFGPLLVAIDSKNNTLYSK